MKNAAADNDTDDNDNGNVGAGQYCQKLQMTQQTASAGCTDGTVAGRTHTVRSPP